MHSIAAGGEKVIIGSRVIVEGGYHLYILHEK